MNQKKEYISLLLPALLVIFSVIINLSCQEDMKESVPKVTSVRYTAPDSAAPIASVGMGATIAIQGSGLKDVQKVKFNTIEKTLNPNYVTDNSIVVTVPDDFPTEITNQVCLYTASDKEYCFDFVIEIPGPGIVSVNYRITGSETPDIITLTGSAFAEVKSLTIGTPDQIASGTGTVIYEYQVNNTYTQLDFNVPPTFVFEQTEIVLVCVAGSDKVSIDWAGVLIPKAFRISNEYAMIGDTTAIWGQNLASIETVTFGGIEVTNFWESDDFETLYMIVPEGVTPGNVTVSASNAFGDVSLTFRYAEADVTILDFDDSLVCWPVAQQSKFDMIVINGDTNKWGYMRGNIDPSWWDETKMYCRCDTSYTLLSTPDALNKVAIKFEVNVRKPWSGGGVIRLTFMQFVTGAGADDEMFYYLWAPEYSDENPYTSDGWMTVTVPLSDFEINGTYDPGEFDITGLKDFRVKFFHDGNQTEPLTDMDVNIDNIRLVIL